jgi:hypothetical protein
VAETDPYAILGVPRTASREEIARAYRTLAKRHHPDVAAAPSPTMARINEAWHILSDPGRRARWDRRHTVVTAAPHWSAAPAAERIRRRSRPSVPEAPPSRMDSGWMAAAVVVGVAVVVTVVMIGVAAVSGPPDERKQFAGPEVRFAYPDSWYLAPGDGTDPPGHRVIAHLTSFHVTPVEECTSFSEPCRWSVEDLPSGAASVLITAWEGDEPPVPEPVIRRPAGLDADAIVGGRPAAFDLRSAGDDAYVAWWQLSPPGFPDRWIEVRADVRGGELERTRLFGQLEAILESLEFDG